MVLSKASGDKEEEDEVDEEVEEDEEVEKEEEISSSSTFRMQG